MLYRLMNQTSDGIDAILKFLDIFIRTEALNDMKANANTITTVYFLTIYTFLFTYKFEGL